jgi:hypothetical protein
VIGEQDARRESGLPGQGQALSRTIPRIREDPSASHSSRGINKLLGRSRVAVARRRHPPNQANSTRHRRNSKDKSQIEAGDLLPSKGKVQREEESERTLLINQRHLKAQASMRGSGRESRNICLGSAEYVLRAQRVHVLADFFPENCHRCLSGGVAFSNLSLREYSITLRAVSRKIIIPRESG